MKHVEKRLVQVIPSCWGIRRRRVVCLVPLFIVLTIVILLYDSVYDTLSTSKIRNAIAHLPHKIHRLEINGDPAFLKPLKEQYLNLTDETKLAKLLQLWKEPNLLNLYFTWLKNNETICHLNENKTSHSKLKLLPILIHTARSHFEERQVIKKSWGSISDYKNWTIRLVFLLGEADRRLNLNPTELEILEIEDKLLNEEQIRHGDLVIGSFTDTYKNLTYKHLMGYKWILNFCQNAEFILKGDDDVFLDVLKLIDWRRSELEMLQKENKLGKVSELYCHKLEEPEPIREVESKWHAPVEEWPGEYYPDYCRGWGYLITVDLIQKIYSVSNLIKFYWIDDLFVTGALLEVVRRVYHYEPYIRDLLWTISMEPEAYLKFCVKGDFKRNRGFGVVVPLNRGRGFERDMMCLWNKTLHDFKDELS